MESVLAEALLSQCKLDPGALLRALRGCGGPGEAPLSFSAAQAEALRVLLERAAGRWGEEEGGEAALGRLAWAAAWDLCLPALLLVGGGGASPEERLARRAACCRALRRCAALCGAPLAERLAREALRGGAGDGAAAVEVLAAVAPWLEEPELLERTVAAALGWLWAEEEEEEAEEAALLAGGKLLPALGRNAAARGRLWAGLVVPAAPEGPPRAVSRALLALSALADTLFLGCGAVVAGQEEPPPPPDARQCSGFWRTVQRGLTAGEALCRKRARHLVKRAAVLGGSEEEEEENPRWEGRSGPEPDDDGIVVRG